MWEWTNRILKPRRQPADRSLLSAYKDLIRQNHFSPPGSDYDLAANALKTEDTPVPSAPEMKNILLSRIRNAGLNLELRECLYSPQTWQEMDNCFAKYIRRRAVFLKFLGYSRKRDCRAAGLGREDISVLRHSLAPENYNTHLKIPLDFGGSLDFENYSLVPVRPVHNFIHRLIDFQIENGYLRTRKKMFIPWFEGKIYHD